MAEINYNFHSTRSNRYPRIKKLGVCGPSKEMTPFVWNGKLMRLELDDPSNGLDKDRGRAMIRDCETGAILSYFGEGTYYHSGFVDGDTFHVIGVDYKTWDTFRIFSTKDLIHWEDRVLFTNPGWSYCNTSLTKGPDGYVLLMEAWKPEEFVGEPYTLFFATSPDLQNWTHMSPEHCLSKERYNGGPWMKYADGWYYVISVTLLPCRRYTNYIFRTKDFLDWEVGFYNPILMSSEEDHIISPTAHDIDEETYKHIKNGFNINNSDIDMCDWNGKVYINYLVSNQMGTFAYMCEAEAEGTVDEFLKSYFR